MDVTLGTLNNSLKAVAVLYKTQGLSAVAAYRVAKNYEAIAKEVNYYDAQRIKLCEKYAHKDENGNPVIENESYVINPGANLDYIDEIKALMKETADVNLKKLSLDDISPAGLSPAQIMSIEFMLDVE